MTALLPYIRYFRRPLYALAVLLLLGAVMAWRWQPERLLRAKQQAFWQAIIDHDSQDALPLISEDYADQWHFDREKLRLALRDISQQYMVIVITTLNENLSIQGDTATWSGRPQLDGRGISPLAGTIQSELNSLHHPFVFTWKKESFWPWSWRLMSVTNESLPTLPEGYKPGMLSDKDTLSKLSEAVDVKN